MLQIETFTAFANSVDTLEILVTSDTAIANASIIYTDNTIEDILLKFVPAGPPDEYIASVPPSVSQPTFADGIFTLDIANDTDQVIVSIGNLLLASQHLLDQTIRGEFDCVLLQNLEGVRQLLVANEGDLARSIYYDLQRQAAACTDAPMLSYHIEKTNIWIENNTYVIF